MKSVILNMMMLGIIGGLVGEEASAALFKSKSKTDQTLEDNYSEGAVKRTMRKTKESVKRTAEKVRKNVSDAFDKDKRRKKTQQKARTKEESPINTMFKSKADIEYNMSYLNDTRKSFKSAANAVEKTSTQVENAFAVRSLLFETALYLKLFDKFSEQYIEGMSRLQKAKKYNGTNFNLAMNAFENALDIIRYAKTQHDVISYVQNLVTSENLKNLSKEEASNVSKKLKKLADSIGKISEDMEQLKENVSAINELTTDKNFKSWEIEMLNCIEKEINTPNKILSMLKIVSETVQSSDSSSEDQENSEKEDSGYESEEE